MNTSDDNILPRDNNDRGENNHILTTNSQVAPFAFTIEQLQKLVDPKSIDLLNQLGGVENLCRGLLVDPTTGLHPEESSLPGTVKINPIVAGDIQSPKELSRDSSASSIHSLCRPVPFSERQKVYGKNFIEPAPPTSLWTLIKMAFSDKILILLSIAALVSLSLGLYEDFGQHHDPNEPKIKWIEGFAIIIAIFIVVAVGSLNDYQKEKQFRKLNAKKEDRTVKAIRGGKEINIQLYDVCVGDILLLEPGDIIGADGVFLSGHNLKCDESAATGESDAMKKNLDKDPFIISGSKVLEGVGKYIVTAVGRYSFNGKTMMGLQTQPEDTPLQIKLNVLAEKIAKLGSAAALLILLVLAVEFFILSKVNKVTLTAEFVTQSLVQIIISAITIVVVAVPEGLPLAVTLSLAFATTRMLKDNNLVRVLAACETMGGATTICSDKTGTLTQNKMTVVAGSFALDGVTFDSESKISTLPITESEMLNGKGSKFETLVELLNQSIAINSSAFEETDEKGEVVFCGSKTETALLSFQKRLGYDFNQFRANANVVFLYPFSSERKSMSTIIRYSKPDSEKPIYRLMVKGASEIVLGYCSHYFSCASEIPIQTLNGNILKRIDERISSFASQALRTIIMAYRDFTAEEFEKLTNLDSEPPLKKLVYLGLVGIEDPLRPGVSEAVRACQKAGVFVRMVTGDNVETAKAIALKSGIYSRGFGVVMEGIKFRSLPDQEKDRVIPRLQVLARSSPMDKQILVERLKLMGQTVAVTGDGTNDGPALKMADVGFSMGIAGTEVAKEASSIILMDDNFSSIVKAIMWGRCVSDAIKKFLQFQLTVNVTAVALTFISAIIDSQQSSVLSAVQLLWVNLIMDTMAALALATEKPTLELLNRKPESKKDRLITPNMWKMIFTEALLQIFIGLFLLYNGSQIFTGIDPVELKTLVFNTFVFMQLFNLINCRRLDNRLNVFHNLGENYMFMVIFFIIIFGQILIIQFGGVAFKTVSLDPTMWAISIVLGFLSIPVGVIARLIPDDLLCCSAQSESTEEVESPPMYTHEQVQWQSAINQVRTQLQVFRTLRGGRLYAATAVAVSSGTAVTGLDPFGTNHFSWDKRKRDQDPSSI